MMDNSKKYSLKNRALLLVTACSVVGIVIGGASNWIDSHQCLQAQTLTNECLTQEPAVRTLQGMGSGFLAGTGAAIGILWQRKQEN